MIDWNQFQNQLASPKEISIVSHRSPDGDSVGSSLAMKHFLEKSKHRVEVITPDKAPSFLDFLSGYDTILNGIDHEAKVKEKLANAEIIFAMDFNSLDRLGNIQEMVTSNQSAFIINIDHHQEPKDFADIQLSNTSASSTCELVFECIEKLNGLSQLDVKTGECIYTGLVTDTGSFRFSSTTEITLRVAAHLLKVGVQPASIYQHIYDSFSIDRLKLMGFALNERFVFYQKFNTGVIYLSEKDLNQFNFRKGDTEGLVNYPLSVKEIKMAILITEKEGKVKLSLRSKGDFHVNEIAKKYFNGGGHFNAAGGISDLNVEETLKKIENFLPDYEAALSN